ncbi:hypothetical protein pEaSNUABM5_00261 [Erwinia phage pEa_SNUABM_5]|uniref:Uncharacterized protein n=1 Tax=Erwinia phage pEa_SNUABM_5 TaxID=2797313 RepID=A0A7T8EPP0_9CAUD|nr:hypothetical protein MPK73_gp261 [Erwinia phage pEa_SNUABM_5]QQO90403.1 hypothetical protein pEaSNUABM5_00261 [Erwinia phage pEa_SNUABM_5]
MTEERYAGQIDAEQVESVTALIERINPQLPKGVQLVLFSADETGLGFGMLMVVKFDDNGEETGDWGWHIDLPTESGQYAFTYAGNFCHENEGKVPATDEALVQKIRSLEF